MAKVRGTTTNRSSRGLDLRLGAGFRDGPRGDDLTDDVLGLEISVVGFVLDDDRKLMTVHPWMLKFSPTVVDSAVDKHGRDELRWLTI